MVVASLVLMLAACDQSANTKKFDAVFPKASGKWKIINYWAAWCKSCVSEIPEFNAFYKKHTGKNAEVYGVYFSPLKPIDLKEMSTKLNIHYPLMMEDALSNLALGDITGIPTTFVVNPQGRVVAKLVGPQSQETLEKIIKN